MSFLIYFLNILRTSANLIKTTAKIVFAVEKQQQQ